MKNLFAYFDAVVNSWCECWRIKNRLSKRKFKRKNFYKKFDYLIALAAANISAVDVQKLKRIRNKVVHFELGYDLFVYDGVGLSKLLECEQLVLRWIKKVGEKLDLLPMINTAKLGRKIMQNFTKEDTEEYCYNEETVDK